MNNVGLNTIILAAVQTIVGGLVALLPQLISYMYKRKGKLYLYALHSYSLLTGDPVGFYKNSEGEHICVPLKIEFSNTSHIPRFARDINMYAYLGSKKVARFSRKPSGTTYNFKKEGEFYEFGNNGMYTVVLPEMSTMFLDFEYYLYKKDMNPNKTIFDKLVLTYYDEKNKLHSCCLLSFNSEDCWKIGAINVCDKNWNSDNENWIEVRDNFRIKKI